MLLLDMAFWSMNVVLVVSEGSSTVKANNAGMLLACEANASLATAANAATALGIDAPGAAAAATAATATAVAAAAAQLLLLQVRLQVVLEVSRLLEGSLAERAFVDLFVCKFKVTC